MVGIIPGSGKMGKCMERGRRSMRMGTSTTGNRLKMRGMGWASLSGRTERSI